MNQQWRDENAWDIIFLKWTIFPIRIRTEYTIQLDPTPCATPPPPKENKQNKIILSTISAWYYLPLCLRQSYGRRHNPSIFKTRLTPTSDTSKVIRTAAPASLYKHQILRMKDTRYKHRFLSTQLSRTPEISPLRARNCQQRELPEQTTFHRDGLSVFNYCCNLGTSLTWHLDAYFWFCFLVYRGSSVSLQRFVLRLLAVM